MLDSQKLVGPQTRAPCNPCGGSTYVFELTRLTLETCILHCPVSINSILLSLFQGLLFFQSHMPTSVGSSPDILHYLKKQSLADTSVPVSKPCSPMHLGAPLETSVTLSPLYAELRSPGHRNKQMDHSLSVRYELRETGTTASVGFLFLIFNLVLQSRLSGIFIYTSLPPLPNITQDILYTVSAPLCHPCPI